MGSSKKRIQNLRECTRWTLSRLILTVTVALLFCLCILRISNATILELFRISFDLIVPSFMVSSQNFAQLLVLVSTSTFFLTAGFGRQNTQKSDPLYKALPGRCSNSVASTMNLIFN